MEILPSEWQLHCAELEQCDALVSIDSSSNERLK